MDHDWTDLPPGFACQFDGGPPEQPDPARPRFVVRIFRTDRSCSPNDSVKVRSPLLGDGPWRLRVIEAGPFGDGYLCLVGALEANLRLRPRRRT